LRGNAKRYQDEGNGDLVAKFGKLILRKIVDTVSTRCHILQLKSTKFDFDFGFPPDPAAGAYSAPMTPWLDLMRTTSKGRDGRKDGREGQGRGEKGVKRRGEGGGVKMTSEHSSSSKYTPLETTNYIPSVQLHSMTLGGGGLTPESAV